MKISATIINASQENQVLVSTNGNEKEVQIPAKKDGRGSSVNGGELLLLSIATCFCNDIYREAARKHIEINGVRVSASGDFAREGEAGTNISYEVHIQSPNPEEQIRELISYVDSIAEIHKTIRQGVQVTLTR